MGRFEGLTNGYQPAWNEFAIANGYWAISINSNLYPQLDFGLYWGCLEAEITKLHLGKFSRPKWIRSCPKILAQPQGSLSSKILLGTTLLDPHPVAKGVVMNHLMIMEGEGGSKRVKIIRHHSWTTPFGEFQGTNWVTGRGRVVKNCENWGDVVYGWSLNKIPITLRTITWD